MKINNRKGSNMATLLRTIRLVVLAAAAMALMVPAAQARPIGVPVSKLQTHAYTSILKDKLQLPPVIRMSVTHSTPTASGGGFDWTDASIGAALATVLIGLSNSGVRMNHRRTAQV
jgi:hypothetical protein